MAHGIPLQWRLELYFNRDQEDKGFPLGHTCTGDYGGYAGIRANKFHEILKINNEIFLTMTLWADRMGLGEANGEGE